MWEMIPSLDTVVQGCAIVFTEPTLATFRQVLIGWIMCLGSRTEYHVFETIQADEEISRQERHPFDRFYNFFSRAKWEVVSLAQQVAITVVARLALIPPGLLFYTSESLAFPNDTLFLVTTIAAFAAVALFITAYVLSVRVRYVTTRRSTDAQPGMPPA